MTHSGSLFLDEQVPSGKDQRTCSVDTYFERRIIGSKKTGEQVALATQCPVYDLIINDPDIVHLVCGKYVCFALM